MAACAVHADPSESAGPRTDQVTSGRRRRTVHSLGPQSSTRSLRSAKGRTTPDRSYSLMRSLPTPRTCPALCVSPPVPAAAASPMHPATTRANSGTGRWPSGWGRPTYTLACSRAGRISPWHSPSRRRSCSTSNRPPAGAQTGIFSPAKLRRSDVFVLCLLHHQDEQTLDLWISTVDLLRSAHPFLAEQCPRLTSGGDHFSSISTKASGTVPVLTTSCSPPAGRA